MAGDRDAQHHALHASVEALHKAIRPRRIGLGLSMLHPQLAAGLFKAVSGEARAAVGEHVRDLEGQRRSRLGGRRSALPVNSSSLTARWTHREQRSMATYR